MGIEPKSAPRGYASKKELLWEDGQLLPGLLEDRFPRIWFLANVQESLWHRHRLVHECRAGDESVIGRRSQSKVCSV